MRNLLVAVAVVSATLTLASPARAQNAQITGFGGLTFGDVTDSSNFGGNLAVPLTDNIHVIAEGGRVTDVLPSVVEALVDFSPVGFGVSAWYGQAGVRLTGSSHRAISPYAEATAGYARLSARTSGLGSTAGALTLIALDYFDRTDPMLGVGGGFLVQGGPLLLDLGYRYKKVLAGDSIQGAFTGGDFSLNEVRIGVGLRF
jgi:opacity protein-like surface antigen